ncbi:hypothetical protein PM082_022025 [Marasmius tenuissimus]|nr:hypothetical protein PM082_022025 [Marasmius tenuissimus]
MPASIYNTNNPIIPTLRLLSNKALSYSHWTSAGFVMHCWNRLTQRRHSRISEEYIRDRSSTATSISPDHSSNSKPTLHQVGDHVEYQAIGAGNVQDSTTSGIIVDIIDEKWPAGEAGAQVDVRTRTNTPRDLLNAHTF